MHLFIHVMVPVDYLSDTAVREHPFVTCAGLKMPLSNKLLALLDHNITNLKHS